MANDLGKTLKQRRVLIPLTLRQLSDKSGVSPSYLARIENGKRFPSASILRKIAQPLGLGEVELLTLAGFLSPPPTTEAKRRSVVGDWTPMWPWCYHKSRWRCSVSLLESSPF